MNAPQPRPPPPQCVTAVEPEWLAELGPMFFSVKVRGGDEGQMIERVDGWRVCTLCVSGLQGSRTHPLPLPIS